jgi:tetratricopeptide (TPR) repeat protein
MAAEVLRPGRWPRATTVQRFLEEGRLERLLSIYVRAMGLDPDEAAYPWNLSSVLRRLGQLELAHAYLLRAIHLGEEQGDADYCGADAYLALAEIAVDSGDDDQALVALARARGAPDACDDVKAHSERLLAELGERSRGDGPSLSALLAKLAA